MRAPDDAASPADEQAGTDDADREQALRYRRFPVQQETTAPVASVAPLPDDVRLLFDQLDRLRWHVESVQEALVAGQAKELPAWLRPEFRLATNEQIARQLAEAHGACAYTEWPREWLAAEVVRWRANLRFLFVTAKKIFPKYGEAGALRLVEAMGTPVHADLTQQAKELIKDVLHKQSVSPVSAAAGLTQRLISRRYEYISLDYARQGADEVVKAGQGRKKTMKRTTGVTPPDSEFRQVIEMVVEMLSEDASKKKGAIPARKTTRAAKT